MASDSGGYGTESALVRFGKLTASIAVLAFVTVIVGYGGWALLTISTKLGGPDPETADGDLLRERLLAWPERNRKFMRNNGYRELLLKPWAKRTQLPKSRVVTQHSHYGI